MVVGLAVLQSGDPLRIGRYRLIGRLGSGGMGTVFLARASGGGDVAVKMLRPEVVGNASVRTRFAREVQALTRIQSPCTARVLEAAVDADTPYLVTEYIPGPTLAEHVAVAGPVPLVLLHGIAVGLAAALAAIHRADVVHRDLKPSNVILAADGPKVIDFGIAVAEGATALTESGAFVGTPAFMSPEQVNGTAGRPSDVFNWGLTVAFAATGRPPFGTGTPGVVAYRVLHNEPDLRGVPAQARSLVEGALAKDPGARPTAEQLLGHLTGAARGAEQAATSLIAQTWSYESPLPPPTHPRLPRRRRWRTLAPLTAALAIALISVTTAVLLRGGPAPAARGTTRGTTATARPSPTVTTEVKTFAPWNGQNLSVAEKPIQSVRGSCWEGSVAVYTRPDAFRCMDESNGIYDPCFSGDSQMDKVACPDGGDPTKVVVITLTKPLPVNTVSPTPGQIDPWLVILRDGQHCTANTGTAGAVGADRAGYSCSGGASLYGVLDRSRQPWQVRYQPTGANAVTAIDVTTVWD